MKDAIPTDRLLFEISPRAYLYGAGTVVFACAADRASEEHDVTMVFTLPILEVCAVTDSVEHILVCALHLDPIRPGRGIMDILPEVLVGVGARIVILNHAEHLITSIVPEKTTQRAVEARLVTAVCASSLAEIHAVASLGPDLPVVEPTELIGTGKPSGFDYVEASNRAVCEISPGVRVLQGAGTSTPADVEAVIRNGADATGPLSVIATVSDPSVMAEAMIRTACRGWDVRPRSRRPTITTEREETMKVHREMIDLQPIRNHPTFHDVTKGVKAALKRSGVKDGIAVVYNHHTTCSVLMQECSHDKTYYGLEYLRQDLVSTMERIAPRRLVGGQYMHPGPAYICFAMDEAKEEGEWASLNTDAHLRSVFFGRSETTVVADGESGLSEFGHIYSVDQDQIRDHPRQCQVQVIEE